MNIKNIRNITLDTIKADKSIFDFNMGGLYPGQTIASFEKNIDLINRRINSIHKHLAYWDLYNIKSAILSSEDFNNKISSLSPGEAIVLNTNTFPYSFFDEKEGKHITEYYSRGDVFVKTIDGSTYRIPTLSSGLFYPKQIAKTDSYYSLKFGYTSVAPQKNTTVTTAVDDDAAGPAETMIFTGLEGQAPGIVYGIFQTVQEGVSVTFDAQYNSDSDLIMPVIKFFIQDTDGFYEEIVFDDLVIELNSSTFSIGNIPAVPYDNLFVQIK